MQERRQHIRIHYRNTVMVKIRDVTGYPELANTLYMGTTKDVSESGVCIRIETELPDHTEMFLCVVVLDPEGLYTLQGKVMWCQKLENLQEDTYHMGIELMFNDTQASSWLRMVERLKDKTDPE